MAGRRSRKNPVTVQGPWFAAPLDFLRSRACAELSPHAVKMLLDLCSQLGPNARGNGDLSAAPAVMGPRGWSGNSSRVAALQELIDADLLVITRRGNRRLCTLYAITLWPLDCDPSKIEIGPGAFTSSMWTQGSKVRSDPPTVEHPATWKAARRGEPKKPQPPSQNEISPPATGQPPVDIYPQRDNTKRRQREFVPATGT